MNDLSISEADLEERRKKLPRKINRLYSIPSYIQASYQPLGIFGKAIALHQGQKGELSYKDCRVSLPSSYFSISYYKIWKYVGTIKGKKRKETKSLSDSVFYRLERAYLHLFKLKSSGDENKVLFLHCDPYEPKNTEHYRYKVAPHVHFEIAGNPWRNAHIPLCDGWQDHVLKNIDTLDSAFSRALDFIADQVMPLVKRQ